ncbi:LysM peptidoglycan-binding domain-containing protein [Aeromicrobium sp. Sec7.5]|uniref:LysM peptidoglycan-binding domain-containing protein n=1 Tax=Aeromicrobium sp. Sec7.5 TaxID=3121276 RepID=UPI002FE495D7
MLASRTRRLLATAAGAGLGLTLSVPDLASSGRAVAGADLADALGGVAVLALAGLSLWLLVATALIGLALRTGTGLGLARRIAPAWLATTLSTGALLLAPAAHATPADLDGLPLPDRAPAVAASGPTVEEISRPAPPGAPAATVTVRAGDCLWDLATRHAPAAASDREVARLTRVWHEANRAVIGADPDVLRPGQVLTIPVDGQVAP